MIAWDARAVATWWRQRLAMTVARLTKRSVDTILPADRQFVVFDTDLKGFGLRVLPSGARSWVVEYRPHPGGRGVAKKRITIGSAATLTPDEARKRAREILAGVSLGSDPSGGRASLRNAVTLGQAWQRYRTSHLVRKGRSAATIAGYADHVERLFREWLNKPLFVLGENPNLVTQRHEKITEKHGPYIANDDAHPSGDLQSREAHRPKPSALQSCGCR